VSEPERADSLTASARSLHVAHIMPAAWPAVAARLAGQVARVDASVSSVQLVILVPTPSDAIALSKALAGSAAAGTPRVAPLGTPRRARRLAAGAPAHVIVGTPAVVHSLIAASALDLSGVTGVGIVAAGEFEADAAVLDMVLAELPRGATKTLVAASATPFVDRLIEAQMHGARRLTTAPVDLPATPGPLIEVASIASDSASATLGDVLEIVDAPSAAIVPSDDWRERLARETLTSLGYPADSPLARVVADGNTAGAALVVLLGPPSVGQWTAVMTSPPARIVALVATREREVLASTIPGARCVPFSPSGARGDAAAAEDAMRDRFRRAIGEGFPAREMLALEPLLAEFDALVIAGAALRLFERERDGARRALESRLAAAPRPPMRPPGDRPTGRSGPGGRPPRSDDRGRPPRGDDRGRPQRGDDRGRPAGSSDRGRPPRGDDRGRPGRPSTRPTSSPRARQ